MKKPAVNNWYVITGGPSTGKTTLLVELKKLGRTIIPEASRVLIDEELKRGRTAEELRKDEKNFQLCVFDLKLKNELNHQKDQLTFLDRGMHDTLAYLDLYGIEVEQRLLETIKNIKYKKVFLLDPLYVFTVDYARTETKEESKKLNDLLYSVYLKYGMEPTKVPVLSPRERAEFVLRHI